MAYTDTTVYTECTVCLEPKKEEYSILRPCGHSGFCASCLKVLIPRDICPRCRQTIVNNEEYYSLKRNKLLIETPLPLGRVRIYAYSWNPNRYLFSS